MYNQHKKNKQLLSTSIKQDAPYKESKKRQIDRWYEAHWLITNYWFEGDPLCLEKVFTDEACWEETNTLEEVKLNRYILAKKLLALKTKDGKGFFLSDFDRYSIACWCCSEKDIRAIFEEFKLKKGNNVPVDAIVSELDSGVLMVFWSHFINNREQQLPLNGEHVYVYGFRCAMFERIVEALEFFWEKLQSADSLSLEQKEDLLMEVALFKRIAFSANADMIDFTVRHLKQDKYPELLKRDIEKNSYHSTIRELENDYFFISAKKLFKIINPEKFSFPAYSATINSIFDIIKGSPSDNKLISACEDYLTFIWHCQGFEMHKQSFLHNLTQTFCRSRDLIFDLIRSNRANTTILSEIINDLSPQEMEDIKQYAAYEVFIKYKKQSSDSSKIIQLSDLSPDIEHLQQQSVSLPQGDSIAELERNRSIPNIKGDIPDLFNPRLP